MEKFKQYKWTGEKLQQSNYVQITFSESYFYLSLWWMFCTLQLLFTILLITFCNTGRSEATWRRERKKKKRKKEDTMPSLEEIPRLIRKETLRRHFYRVQGVEDREAWQHTFRSEAIAHTEKLQGSGRLHSAGVRKPLSPHLWVCSNSESLWLYSIHV